MTDKVGLTALLVCQSDGFSEFLRYRLLDDRMGINVGAVRKQY